MRTLDRMHDARFALARFSGSLKDEWRLPSRAADAATTHGFKADDIADATVLRLLDDQRK